MLIAFNANAQIITDNSKPYIEVIGSSMVEIVPDEIFINVNISERYDKSEKQTIEMQEKKLKNALKIIGLDVSNIVTSASNANYVEKKKTGEVFASKQYIIKTSSANQAAHLFQQLDVLNFDNAKVAHTGHSKMDSIIQSVKQLAIKAADTKADYLLNAIGNKKGKPMEISELPNKTAQPNFITNTTQHYKGIANAKVVDIEQVEFQLLKIQAQIYVKFSIL